MSTDWNAVARRAGDATDEQFATEITNLSRFNKAEIEEIIVSTGISKRDLANVLGIVQDSTRSNSAKAANIKTINFGVDALVGMIGKLI